MPVDGAPCSPAPDLLRLIAGGSGRLVTARRFGRDLGDRRPPPGRPGSSRRDPLRVARAGQLEDRERRNLAGSHGLQRRVEALSPDVPLVAGSPIVLPNLPDSQTLAGSPRAEVALLTLQGIGLSSCPASASLTHHPAEQWLQICAHNVRCTWVTMPYATSDRCGVPPAWRGRSR